MSNYISEEPEVTSKLRVDEAEKSLASSFPQPQVIPNANVNFCVSESICMIDTPLTAAKCDEEKDNRGLGFINSGLPTMHWTDSEEATRAEVAEDRRMVGVIVMKMCESDQIYILGKVVGYDEEKRTYKIEYEDEHMEEVNKNELFELVAPIPMVSEYKNRVEARKKEKQKRKRVATTEASNPPKSRLANYKPRKSSKSKSEKLTNKSTRDSALQDRAPYVPLAVRETRRDAYYYY